MLDLRLDGGQVVTTGKAPSVHSIGIKDGRIAAVGDLHEVAARETLDVTGTYVLPGIIDTHVHLGFSSPEKEFETESHAAARNGVTTALIYFRDLRPYDDILRDFISQGERDSAIDFAVHLGILHDEHLASLGRYVEHFGIRSIKMYTTYKHGELRQYGVVGQDDGFILDVMRAAARLPDLTVNVHCENDDIAERGRRYWVKFDSPPLEQWSQARPAFAEAEAIHRVGFFARETGCTLYVPHISSERALKAVLEEQAKGARIAIETCPHYLHAQSIQGAGTLAKVNPPVRTGHDGDILWQAVADHVIDTVGSDHAAQLRANKAREDVFQAMPGFPGIGTLLPVLLDGVNQGRIPIQEIARLQARAARIFRLAGKGAIAQGHDADLAVVDIRLKKMVDPKIVAGISDFSPFEGMELTGWPVMTIGRGRVLARGDTLASGAGFGRYLRGPVPARPGHWLSM